MPRALEPGGTETVWLDIDADKPEATRPTFDVIVRSMRDHGPFMERVEAAEDRDALLALLTESVVTWRNMVKPDGTEIPYSPDEFETILTPADAWELVALVIQASTQTTSQKKRFELPASSDSGSSANTAVINAETCPPNGSPS